MLTEKELHGRALSKDGDKSRLLFCKLRNQRTDLLSALPIKSAIKSMTNNYKSKFINQSFINKNLEVP